MQNHTDIFILFIVYFTIYLVPLQYSEMRQNVSYRLGYIYKQRQELYYFELYTNTVKSTHPRACRWCVTQESKATCTACSFIYIQPRGFRLQH